MTALPLGTVRSIGRLAVCVALVAVLAACATCSRREEGARFSFVRVANDTSIEILAALEFENGVQPFGYIAPGAGATIGFSDFRLGPQLTVRWEYDSGGLSLVDLAEISVVDTKQYLSLAGERRTLQVVFQGEGRWEVSVLDADRQVLEPGSSGD